MSLPLSPSLSPGAVGIGLKPQHAQALLDVPRPVDFLELHAENHMTAGGPERERLHALADAGRRTDTGPRGRQGMW